MKKRHGVTGFFMLLFLVFCLSVPSKSAQAASNFDLIHAVDQKKIRAGEWKKDKKGTRYIYENGRYPRLVWLKISGKYYYFDREGYVKTGWVSFKQNRYFLSRRSTRLGELLLGRQKINGKTYYFNPSTAIMARGWTQIGSKWYYFREDNGVMTQNKWVEGRYLQADGAMLVNGWADGKYVGADGYVVEDPSAEEEGRLIFMGDSRTVGMKASVGGSDLYIAKSSQGYTWLTRTAVKTLEKKLAAYPISKVILNFGVNDLGNINAYISLYKELMKDYPKAKFYIMSVNPMQEKKGKWNATNKQIEKFNKAMKAAFGKQYIDCYSELKKKGFKTVDGLHYTAATYQKIYKFAVNAVTGA